MTKRPTPFQASHQPASHDTIEALEQMLDEARRGRLIGMACVAMYKRREFYANATGEAFRNPTFSRGMVAVLDDYLRDMVYE